MKKLLILTLCFMSALSQAQEKPTIKLTQRVRHIAEDLVFFVTVTLNPGHSYGGGSAEFDQLINNFKQELEERGIAFNRLKKDELDHLLAGYEKEGMSYRFETTELEEIKIRPWVTSFICPVIIREVR